MIPLSDLDRERCSYILDWRDNVLDNVWFSEMHSTAILPGTVLENAKHLVTLPLSHWEGSEYEGNAC